MLSKEEVEVQQQELELIKRLKEEQGFDDVDIHDPLVHEAVLIARSGGLRVSYANINPYTGDYEELISRADGKPVLGTESNVIKIHKMLKQCKENELKAKQREEEEKQTQINNYQNWAANQMQSISQARRLGHLSAAEYKRIHSVEYVTANPYGCKYCSFRAPTKDQVKTHSLRTHNAA